jgi:hypothetical protein
MLLDMAVTAWANAVSVQSISANTSALIQAELFGKPTPQGQRKQQRANRQEDIRGLSPSMSTRPCFGTG